MIKDKFIFDPVQKQETLLKFYRLSEATFYDRINTLNQFIKPFLDNKKCIFLRNMEPTSSYFKRETDLEQSKVAAPRTLCKSAKYLLLFIVFIFP